VYRFEEGSAQSRHFVPEVHFPVVGAVMKPRAPLHICRSRFFSHHTCLSVTRCLVAGGRVVQKILAERRARGSHCLGRASMKVRVAPRKLLFSSCVLSPPYFSTVLTVPY